FLAQRDQQGIPYAIAVFLRDLFAQDRHGLTGLCERDAILEATHALQVMVAEVGKILRRKGDRHPYVDVPNGQEVKLSRHDANDFIRAVVDRDLAPDDIATSAKAPLPKPITNHRDWRAMRVFVFGEDAP